MRALDREFLFGLASKTHVNGVLRRVMAVVRSRETHHAQMISSGIGRWSRFHRLRFASCTVGVLFKVKSYSYSMRLASFSPCVEVLPM